MQGLWVSAGKVLTKDLIGCISAGSSWFVEALGLNALQTRSSKTDGLCVRLGGRSEEEPKQNPPLERM